MVVGDDGHIGGYDRVFLHTDRLFVGIDDGQAIANLHKVLNIDIAHLSYVTGIGYDAVGGHGTEVLPVRVVTMEVIQDMPPPPEEEPYVRQQCAKFIHRLQICLIVNFRAFITLIILIGIVSILRGQLILLIAEQAIEPEGREQGNAKDRI